MNDLKWEERIDNYLNMENDILKSFKLYLGDISVQTRYMYLQRVGDFLDMTLHKPEELTYDDYASYIDGSRYKDGGEQTTQGYQIVIYSALKRFSEYMYVTKKAPENFMASIRRPRFYESQKTIEKREKGYLTEEEIKKILDQFQNCQTWKEWRDYTVILLMLNTGIRRTAITRINIGDYSREEQSIVVTDKGAKVRKFLLNVPMCDLLDHYISIRKELDSEDKDALFLTEKPYGSYDRIKRESNTVWKKERATSETIYGIVVKYTKCVDGKRISPHKLRATYGTQLYNKTHDIYFVQSCMGHNSPVTTERYVRGGGNKTKDASEILKSLYS